MARPRLADVSRPGAELQARWAATSAALRAEMARNGAARVAARSVTQHAVEVRHSARTVRAVSRAHQRSFRLEGVIDGAPVVAVLRGGELFASDALLARADMISRMGDIVELGGARGCAPAGITGPVAVVLATMVRACDRTVRLALGPVGPAGEVVCQHWGLGTGP